MKNSRFFKPSIGIVVLFACYLTATGFHSDFWGNILSLLCALAASAILLYSYSNLIKFERRISRRLVGICLLLGALSWAAGDLVWLVSTLLNGTMEQSLTASACYFGTNIFFAAATIQMIVMQYRKWNLVILGIDASAIVLSSMILIWNLFFFRNPDNLRILLTEGFFSAGSIFLDIIILTGILIWLGSVKSEILPNSLKMMVVGLILYSITDLYYYYISYYGTYQANTLVDAAYMAGIFIVAFGGLFRISKSAEDYVEQVSNVGVTSRGGIMIIFPMIELLKSLYFGEQILSYEFLILLLIALVDRAACVYVQNALKTEELLKRETEINQELERCYMEQMQELKRMANEDTATTLYNRRYFKQALDQELKKMSENELLILMLIDADRFKTVNDTYGHDVGDQVLIEMAARMKKWNTYGALLARHGGDEFIVMLKGAYSKPEIEACVKGLIQACGRPIIIDQLELALTVSIGISVCPHHATDSVTLMRYADMAMYQAKTTGYNQYVFFDHYLNSKIRRKNKIELLLKKVDIEKNFELHYQPQFSLPEGRLLGAEALLRWNNSEYGFIPPGEFIPVAEEIGMMKEIGAKMARRALMQISEWNLKYRTNLIMGINFSPKQLEDDQFITVVEELFQESNIDPEWVDIEVTENAMLADSEKIDKIFEFFQRLGVSISVDDFGAGYSSLRYLKKYPFNRIKIDKSLIDNITIQESDRKIIAAIIAMSKSIGMEILAEGVETLEQSDMLVQMGCGQAQGYLLGKPVPAEQFEREYIKDMCFQSVV
jgi:diguanylate cyclase (GGDEF)-like protein